VREPPSSIWTEEAFDPMSCSGPRFLYARRVLPFRALRLPCRARVEQVSALTLAPQRCRPRAFYPEREFALSAGGGFSRRQEHRRRPGSHLPRALIAPRELRNRGQGEYARPRERGRPPAPALSRGPLFERRRIGAILRHLEAAQGGRALQDLYRICRSPPTSTMFLELSSSPETVVEFKQACAAGAFEQSPSAEPSRP